MSCLILYYEIILFLIMWVDYYLLGRDDDIFYSKNRVIDTFILGRDDDIFYSKNIMIDTSIYDGKAIWDIFIWDENEIYDKYFHLGRGRDFEYF